MTRKDESSTTRTWKTLLAERHSHVCSEAVRLSIYTERSLFVSTRSAHGCCFMKTAAMSAVRHMAELTVYSKVAPMLAQPFANHASA
jgi:hypothetical protein